MNKEYKISGVTGLLILALGAVSGAYADAYRNPAPTAEGIAKSGAMMIFSDDASAISYNPANLAEVKYSTNGLISATTPPINSTQSLVTGTWPVARMTW